MMVRTLKVLVLCYVTLASSSSAYGGMSMFAFSFENDGQLNNGPFGTLKVVEGLNVVNTLTFTIDLDQNKLGPNVDIHQFGFQLDLDYDDDGVLDVTGVVDLVPKPQTIEKGYVLTELDVMDKVAGFGNTKWDFLLDFGPGANPTLDPVTFTIGASGLTLSALNLADQPYKNNDPKKPKVSNFAVHAQSTSTPGGSEGLGGFYNPLTPQSIAPELSNLCGAIAALFTGMAYFVGGRRCRL